MILITVKKGKAGKRRLKRLEALVAVTREQMDTLIDSLPQTVGKMVDTKVDAVLADLKAKGASAADFQPEFHKLSGLGTAVAQEMTDHLATATSDTGSTAAAGTGTDTGTGATADQSGAATGGDLTSPDPATTDTGVAPPDDAGSTQTEPS